VRQVTQAVVLAGGRGSRLAHGCGGPRLPKVLHHVGSKSMIERVLDALVESSISAIHLCLGVSAQQILNEVLRWNGSRKVALTWTLDGLRAQGTSSALLSAKPHLEDRFLVSVADSLPLQTARIRQLLDCEGDLPTMGVTGECWDVVPNLKLTQGSVTRYEKSGFEDATHIDAGLYVLPLVALDQEEFAYPDLELVWQRLARSGRLKGIDLNTPVFDIGTPKRLQVARTVFS